MSQYIEVKGFQRILLRILGILILPFVLGFLGNIVFCVYLNMQPEPSQKDRLTMGYRGRTEMLNGDQYFDNYRYEYEREYLEFRVDYAQEVLDHPHPDQAYQYQVTITKIGESTPRYKEQIAPVYLKGLSGFGRSIPAAAWPDGEYEIKVYRNGKVVAERKFDLVKEIPWWQWMFGWIDPLKQSIKELFS